MTTLIPWYCRVFVIALFAAALVGFGYVKGLESAAADATKAQLQAAKGTLKKERRQQVITASSAAAHEIARTRIRTVYKTIDREVIQYVKTSAATGCQLPAGWVRLHDAAALARVPGAPGEPDARPSGITATDSLPVITGNYEACSENRQQLIDLQGWIIKQAAQP